MKKVLFITLLTFVTMSMSSFQSANKTMQIYDANDYATVTYWQYTTYSNDAGYYLIVENLTGAEYMMTFTSSLFTDTQLIHVGANIIQIYGFFPYIDGMRIKCGVHDANYNFNLFVNVIAH